MRGREIFQRSELNPIITYRDMPYPCNTVFNPGATDFRGDVLLLLRVEDLHGRSHLTVARSPNGYTDWTIESDPLISPEDGDNLHEEFGCEDARITYMEELGKYVIAYTAYSPLGAGVALAGTTDFKNVEKYGLILAPNNKDAAVFPRTISGRYWMLHRPVAGDLEHIWLTDSPDLRYWNSPWCIIRERGGPWWDGHRIGAGTIPIETEEGWLIIYHGVKNFPAGPIYRTGAALLDLEDPRQVIARLPYWILGAHEPYEMMGEVPNVVFVNGHVRKGDHILLYYGASDTCVCVATARVSELLEALQECRV